MAIPEIPIRVRSTRHGTCAKSAPIEDQESAVQMSVRLLDEQGD